MRIAGKDANAMPWLCVACMPWPSQGATIVMPRDPSQGTSRTSSRNQSGFGSPSGRAVVTMNEVMPDPLPKCLRPDTRQPPSGAGSAVAAVRATSPPLPGSEVIVPNQHPSAAIRAR
jgi:hypothetical protein